MHGLINDSYKWLDMDVTNLKRYSVIQLIINGRNNMSVFYCDSCDSLVDSDYAPDFTYNEETGEWKCESCNEQSQQLRSWGVPKA